MSAEQPAGWEFGTIAATDEDWASSEFDYLQPYIADLMDPTKSFVGGREAMERAAQRTREARPFLVAHIRRSIGEPKWDPRGATVRSIR